MKITTLLIAGMVFSTAACIDPERIVVVVSVDASVSLAEECRQCVSTGAAMSCATTVEECEQNQDCARALACVFERCTGRSFEQFFTCANICVNDNHFVGDTVSDVGIRMYQCIAVGPCRPRCLRDGLGTELVIDAGAPDSSAEASAP
jgi:hypothetical protein